MFLQFDSSEERRQYGGSAFLELQYCRLPTRTPIKQIVAVEAIHIWNRTSLYVHINEIDSFYIAYHEILYGGIYNNCSTGSLDLCGINYYSSARMKEILVRLEQYQPVEHEILAAWLEQGKDANGFYVLGI